MKVLLIILVAIFPLFAAELKDENLLQGLPLNFKLGFHNYNKQTRTRLIEYVAKDETVENWNQMITTCIYHGNLKLTPDEYIKRLATMWGNSCQNSFTKKMSFGRENGYDYSLLMMYCPKSNITQKQEYTYLKAIKGNDSFYTVQKAFTHNPTKEEIVETMKYLKRVQVCDTRLGSCPKIN